MRCPISAPLVEKSGPAVVNVEVVQNPRRTRAVRAVAGPMTTVSTISSAASAFPQPDWSAAVQFQPQPQRGAGSGFIVTPDGYILTNAHVVADADQVTVKLNDRREYQAKVVGVDQRTDVAVIKIEAKDLPTCASAIPSKLKPGEWVLAIGSPFGFENSATAGIVSATARSLPQGDSNYVPFIQTDVAVNPGNSGGPLFNLQGEVVGINSQIFSRTGGYMGLSFAIPIDVAMDVRDQLVKTGKVTRGRIGVHDPERRRAARRIVRPRSSARRARQLRGEGWPGREGRPEAGRRDPRGERSRRSKPRPSCPRSIARVKPGTRCDAHRVARRQGAEDQREGRCSSIEPQIQTASLQGKQDGRGRGDQPRASQCARSSRRRSSRSRPKARWSSSRSRARALAAGVQPGDIILGVNGKKVKSVADLQAAAKSAGKTVALLIQREDAQILRAAAAELSDPSKSIEPAESARAGRFGGMRAEAWPSCSRGFRGRIGRT